MKHSKILAMILSVCLVLGMMPVMAGAEAFSANDYIYFGNDGQKWVVLDQADLLLLSDDVAEQIAYNDGGLDNTWANSDAKAWCDSYADSGFAAEEQAALTEVSFLSKDQAEQVSADVLKASTGWWLSTPSAEDALLAYAVSDAGLIGCPHIAKNYGARPAINLDQDKVVMISAAEAGKNTEMGVVADNASGEWKLTVVSDAYDSFEASDISLNGREISVTFAGAATGENEQVSAIIKNTAGKVLAYGPISAGKAEGTVTFTVPQQVSGNVTVAVFNEKLNGDKETDLSSNVTAQTFAVEDLYGSVKQWGVVLNDGITVRFEVKINTADEAATVQITTVNEVISVPVSQVKTDGYVSVDMAAAQMTDTISVQVLDSNGQGGAVQEYSIRGYAEYLLANSTNEAEKALVKAMLNYGAKSQVYFDYNTEKLANNGINVTESVPGNDGLTATVSGSCQGIRFYGASLLAQHKTVVRFYFVTSADIAQYSFAFGDAALTPELKEEGLYYVDVEGLSPADLDEDISVIVNNELTVTYSPMVYMQRMYHKASSSEDVKSFVKAMYTYYLAAEAYIAQS